MDLTVCILTRDAGGLLRDCLRSLMASLAASSLSSEVIVVDNASSDNTADVLATFPEVKVIRNESNFGFAAGNNQAIQVGQGRYFLLLNNDTIVLENTPALLVDALDRIPSAGIAGGRLLRVDGSTQWEYYLKRLPSLTSFILELFWLHRVPVIRQLLDRGNREPDREHFIAQIPGALMAFRRELIDDIGVLDESFSYWYEDVDFCTRAQRAGWQVLYVPTARVTHFGGASFRRTQLSVKATWRFHGLLTYARKHYPRYQYRLVRLPLAVCMVIRFSIIAAISALPGRGNRASYRQVLRTYFDVVHSVLTVCRDNP